MHSILVIEDNTDLLENILEVLEINGYTVHSAIDGRDGLAKAKAHTPDLVVTDLVMPYMDGFTFMERLQAESSTQKTPVILVTAHAGDEARERGAALGAVAYITKPFEIEDLVILINNYFSGKS